MEQTKNAEAFEQVLLSHVDMCYMVACALTRNQEDARELTREVLIWAWRHRNGADIMTDIKKKLLAELRKKFLRDYRQTARCLRTPPVFAEQATNV